LIGIACQSKTTFRFPTPLCSYSTVPNFIQANTKKVLFSCVKLETVLYEHSGIGNLKIVTACQAQKCEVTCLTELALRPVSHRKGVLPNVTVVRTTQTHPVFRVRRLLMVCIDTAVFAKVILPATAC
jgi:hypothetical protein